MTKKTEEEVKVVEKTETRKPRKKVYERVRESAIPQELVDHFKEDCYDLRLIRFLSEGEEDYRYLYVRERQGYEFVSIDEIPKKMRAGMHTLDTKNHPGLVTVGDLCLMKIDSDLRISRQKSIEAATDEQINSVDMHVLQKRGFRNTGSNTKVLMREPTFQE